MNRLNLLIVLGALTLFATAADAQRGVTPQAECKNAYGQQACGYSCTAAYGQLKCANSPAGQCHAASGQITCWDPPGQVGFFSGVRKAECKNAFGRTACGYNCTAASGQLKCSQTPAGVCNARMGQVTCWDPPPWASALGAQAQCVQQGGNNVCGYHCVKQYGRAACAQTPNGICRAERGQLMCWDPPAPAMGALPTAQQATCKSAYGKTECGYHCTAAYGVVKCAQTPQGACQAAYGKVTCTH